MPCVSSVSSVGTKPGDRRVTPGTLWGHPRHTKESRPIKIRIGDSELKTAAEHGGGEGLEGEAVLFVLHSASLPHWGSYESVLVLTGECVSWTRRSSWALRATTMVDMLIRTAPMAGDRVMPAHANAPAASGMAMML